MVSYGFKVVVCCGEQAGPVFRATERPRARWMRSSWSPLVPICCARTRKWNPCGLSAPRSEAVPCTRADVNHPCGFVKVRRCGAAKFQQSGHFSCCACPVVSHCMQTNKGCRATLAMVCMGFAPLLAMVRPLVYEASTPAPVFRPWGISLLVACRFLFFLPSFPPSAPPVV